MTDKIDRRRKFLNTKQAQGWGRVSALLEPEYLEMWTKLGEKYGSKAEAMRVLAKRDLGT